MKLVLAANIPKLSPLVPATPMALKLSPWTPAIWGVDGVAVPLRP
jgi:hypothetical protein